MTATVQPAVNDEIIELRGGVRLSVTALQLAQKTRINRCAALCSDGRWLALNRFYKPFVCHRTEEECGMGDMALLERKDRLGILLLSAPRRTVVQHVRYASIPLYAVTL